MVNSSRILEYSLRATPSFLTAEEPLLPSIFLSLLSSFRSSLERVHTPSTVFLSIPPLAVGG